MSYKKPELHKIQELANRLAHAIYRDGYIEEVHHKYIPDSEMKKLNKDICNRIYTTLLLTNAPEEYIEDAEDLYCMILEYSYCAGWDKPEISDALAYGERYELLKDIEKAIQEG